MTDPTRGAPRATPARGALGAKAEVVLALELAALVAFSLTQPVLDRFGRAPDVFVFEGAGRLEVVAFALLFSVVPVAGLWILEWGVGLAHPRARSMVHALLVVVAVWLVVVNVMKSTTSASGVPVTLVAAGAAISAGLAYAKADFVRQFLRFAAAALPGFVVLFLFLSPVSDLVLSGSVAAQDDVALDRRPPIVMLVLDELPLASLVDTDGRIDAALFPGFARLAALTTWYRNATAVSGTTWYSVPSTLAGRLPVRDGIPVVTDWPRNLFTLLGDGYRYEVQEALTGLCPTARCDRGTGDGLGGLVRRARDVFSDVASPATGTTDPQATFSEDEDPAIEFDAFERFQPGRFSRFLDRLGQEEPAVHYLHLLLPHTPWRLLPSGRSYPYPERSPGQVEGNWTADSDWPALQARQRHMLQAKYVDGLIGQFLNRMDETGLIDDAVLVVMADHGVAFRPGEPVKGNKEKHAVEAILPEMAWVPLFVRAPGVEAGRIDERNALLIDVLPTIADVVGLDLPGNDRDRGQSLLGPARASADKPWFQAYDSDYFGVLTGERSVLPARRLSEVFALGAGAPASDAAAGKRLQLYAIGPRADIVGRAVADLATGEPAAVDALADLRPFASVDLSSGEVPAMVVGRLSGAPEPGSAVAMALNGRIGAVSPVFPDAGAAAAFAGLVPESWFRDGANDLRLFLVSTRAGDLAARPLAVERTA